MQHNFPIFRTAIGQDSRRFLPSDSSKPCLIGGVIFENVPGLNAESDGDVVFLSICNAISSLVGVPILNEVARDLCRKDGITDSSVYLEKAQAMLGSQKITFISIAIEAKRPNIDEKINLMRGKIAEALHLSIKEVGITATTGDGLTDFGCGDGVHAMSILTTIELPKK